MPFALFAFLAGMMIGVIVGYFHPPKFLGHDEPMWVGWPLLSLALNLATLALVVYFVREDEDFRVYNLLKVTFIAIITISYGLGIAGTIIFIIPMASN